MDEKFRKQLEENGADVNTTLKRFMGNESLYVKYIIKFLEDKNYEGIISNFEKGDYESVFNNAHGLKGVTANLGLNPITAAAAKITELLRNKQAQEVDAEKLNDYIKQLDEAYSRFQRIIEENKQ
ncbi:MAG: Hpt domain-containing protein [Lachnospiraceae bacterium]|nr:Hpt domain-containing protein [Lachnospiraceae bacterium]MDE5781333.1 Hpt domain-containing protein [Lachnospiraceae bacterium]MDE6232554.1 Hpt domain-containing protein [Lachnospiraceae bacterium]MDE6253508.1 Hpt domain-containing protein [Lachnospiraceae bacterium]